MEYLNWELSVLSRAVAYTNLSGAASHVGLSQPQLSRIVARIEGQMGVNLLDREARRRSAWTPAAYRISEIYTTCLQQFRGDVQNLVQGSQLNHIRIGTLEGLTSIALQFAHFLFEKTGVKLLELTVEDLNELEESFGKRNIDVLFTFREPGRRKFKYVKKLGYQTLEPPTAGKGIRVMSSFEYGTEMQKVDPANSPRMLVSNSLEVRRNWIAKFGGHGILPSDVRREKSGKTGEVPVIVVGSEDLPAAFWEKVSTYKA